MNYADAAQILGSRVSGALMVSLVSIYSTSSDAAAPYLTGVVEDGDSQSIEMPSLPYVFLRNVEWMAPEGSYVEADDVIVRFRTG